MCLLQNSLNKINETGFHKEKLRAETFKNKIVHKSEILSMLGIYFDQNTERYIFKKTQF